MADKKITDLPNLTAPEDVDQLAVVDNSANITKRIARSAFLTGAPLPANTVSATNALSDGIVTAVKRKALVLTGNISHAANVSNGTTDAQTVTVSGVGSGMKCRVTGTWDINHLNVLTNVGLQIVGPTKAAIHYQYQSGYWIDSSFSIIDILSDGDVITFSVIRSGGGTGGCSVARAEYDIEVLGKA